MKVAPLATLLGIAGGTTIGLISGYFRGWVDEVLGRIIDAVLALPLIVIAVTALVALGTSNITLIVVIGVVFTPIVARTVRAAVLGERQLDYVSAARLRGERPPYIMFAEILPNIAGPIVVEATVRLGYAIFAVAGLTFLGFGVQPPSPDWSLQISDNYTLLNAGTYEWTVLFPSLAIATLIVGVNLIADGLQQVLDR
jgi:peptide/nickel transport system permease protein